MEKKILIKATIKKVESKLEEIKSKKMIPIC